MPLIRAFPGSSTRCVPPGLALDSVPKPAILGHQWFALPVSERQSEQQEFFIPAETPNEAIARIFAITGGRQQGRGEKRALVALRDALGLDVDVVRTNAVLGARIAAALDIDWNADRYTVRNKVNLAGLNVLLDGAYMAYHDGSLARLRPQTSSTLPGTGWEDFRPAISKIEAVTRIARLTGAPAEWLGPGSKEHKSVLTNLADRLLPSVTLDRSSKTRLGRDIAHELGVLWNDQCYSTGETISLDGLNTILAGAERRLGRLGSSATDLLLTPEQEAAALVAALHDGWKAEPWDGRRAIEWMYDQPVRGYNENEWQGWYFEARGREVLGERFPARAEPVRARYGNTTFDYSLNRVWDLKAHTEEAELPVSQQMVGGKSNMILNDAEAIRACVEEQGLGFLVLGGRAIMDEDQSFIGWHREFKAKQGVKSASSNSGRSRMRKSAFRPLHVEAFWIPDSQRLDAAILAGQLQIRAQGRQAPRNPGEPGAPRQPKFQMTVPRARAGLCVARHDWKYAGHKR